MHIGLPKAMFNYFLIILLLILLGLKINKSLQQDFQTRAVLQQWVLDTAIFEVMSTQFTMLERIEILSTCERRRCRAELFRKLQDLELPVPGFLIFMVRILENMHTARAMLGNSS